LIPKAPRVVESEKLGEENQLGKSYRAERSEESLRRIQTWKVDRNLSGLMDALETVVGD
jgi:hypothetical protein